MRLRIRIVLFIVCAAWMAGSAMARDIGFTDVATAARAGSADSQYIAILAWDTAADGYSVFVEDFATGTQVAKVSLGDVEPVGVQTVPDISGNRVDEIVVMFISSLGEHKALVVEPDTGLILTDLTFAPAFVPMAVAVVSDTGTGDPSIVMLGVNGSGDVRAQIKNATNGSLITWVQFAPNFPPKYLLVIPDVTGNGIDDLVVLGIDAGGNIRAQLKDSLTGALLHWIQFGKEFPPVDMIVIPNIDGIGTPALALLGMHSDGRVRAQIKRADTREQINLVNFAQAYPAVAFSRSGDVTGDNVDEIAVLGINASGDVRAQVKNPITRAQVNVVSFANPYAPKGFLSPGDLGSDNGPDLTVLGLNDGGIYRLQSKDVATKVATPTIQVTTVPVLSIGDAQLVEGDAGETDLEFPVSLSMQIPSAVSFDYATSDGSATAGQDYVAANGAGNIPGGILATTIPVKISGDVIDESDEAFSIDLSNVDNAILGASTADGTILDDDGTPVLRIDPASVTEGDVGSKTLSFDVTLTPQAAQTVTVDYQTSDVTALAGSDYLQSNGTLTFVPGDTLENIDVTVLGDVTNEFNETFDVDLSNAGNAAIVQGSAQGTITNDDPVPTVSISDAGSINESQAGVTNFTFTVSLSAVSGRTVSVNYQTNNGSAISGSDFLQTSGQLTFVPGNTIETVDVVLLDDVLDENTESFTMTLLNAIDAAIGDGSGSASINDNDAAPSVNIQGGSVTEGDAGSKNLQFTVSLSAVSGKTIDVDYQTADESAVAGSDYTANNGNLQFDSGDSQKTFNVSVLGDTLDEFTETFVVSLSNNVNASISVGSDQGTINDNDAAPTISIANSATSEGNAGTKNLTFTVQLSTASGKDISVQYATADGSATAGEDYTQSIGQLDFVAGDASETIDISLLGDLLNEADEVFNVNLSNPSNASILQGSAQGTINNDDPLPSISVSDAGIVNESQAGVTDFEFTVSLSAQSGRTVTVDYQTTDGTADSGADYAQSGGQVTLVPGDTQETVDVVLLDDAIDENTESFTLNLSNPGNATINDGSGNASIADDDPQPSLIILGGSVTEGDGGSQNLIFTVSLSTASGRTVTVDYQTVNETATSGADYTASSGTLTFVPGDTQETLNVSVLGDVIDEFNETFVVNLSNNVNASISTGSDQGTINDNDAAPTVSIADASTVEGDAGTKNMGFSVSLSAPSGKPISVEYDTADGTATAGQDYVAVVDGQLGFAEGDIVKTINIQIIGDIDEEANEVFTVTLSVPSNVTIGTGQAGGTITDNDSPAGQPGLDSRPSNLTCIAPDAPDPGASISLTRVFQSAGAIVQLTAMAQIPGDNSYWYVLEQAGRVKRFQNVASPGAATTALNITGPVSTAHNEAGLLGIAFHPNFGQGGMPHNDELFLSYTAGGSPLQSRISRFTSSDGGVTFDANSEEILLRVDQEFGNHNGGTIGFDPDGYLVAGFGDGGSGGDPNNRAQDTQNLLGTFVRIDVDNGSPYSIPGDNPFAGNQFCDATGFSPNATGCPEIFAYGMRNPWKWSIDSQTGDFWAGDVGQDDWEEVDLIELGGNYGWRFREGAHCFNPANNCPTAGLIDPVAEYNQDNGDATIIAGYVYRGSAIPDLTGVFVFGDTASGRIWGLFDDGQGGLEILELDNSPHVITTFGQDQNGELYMNNRGGGQGGQIYRIDLSGGGGATQTVPDNLSDTGCVLANDPTQPETGLIPFDINARFWSDNAIKERWIAIPDGTTIDIDGNDDFLFPIGTVLMKNFDLNGELIETRLFMRHTDGSWGGYSFEWNDAGTDAVLVQGGKVKNIDGQDWIYPSSNACLSCHTDVAGRSLGPEVAQFNKDFLYVQTGRTDNQLNTFDAIGMFTNPLPGNPDSLAKMPDPYGGDPLEDRARAYLHTNCSQCHRPNGPTPANMDLKYDTAFIDTDTCNVDPTSGNLGLIDPKLIKPGDPANSMIIYRMSRRDVHGMPPLGSNLTDPQGEQLLTDWVNSLVVCP